MLLRNACLITMYDLRKYGIHKIAISLCVIPPYIHLSICIIFKETFIKRYSIVLYNIYSGTQLMVP